MRLNVMNVLRCTLNIELHKAFQCHIFTLTLLPVKILELFKNSTEHENTKLINYTSEYNKFFNLKYSLSSHDILILTCLSA